MNVTILTHAFVAVVAALAAWAFQSNRYHAEIAEIRLEISDAALKAESAARAEERAISTKYLEALNAARTRENAVRRDRDLARDALDGLRGQAADAARALAAAPPAAVLEYAATANELLVDCSRRYQDLAGKADGHAADARALYDAWPATVSTGRVAEKVAVP